MQVVLLSGGSGKRLWPFSNDVRSKQFLRVIPGDAQGPESMLQRVYKQIRKAMPEVPITIATSLTQVSAIKNQLDDNVQICVEPARRDTFPAIALACAFLKDALGCADTEPVVVCPVDPFVEDEFFAALKELAQMAEEGRAAISLLGIQPDQPSEKYGYIIPQSQERVSPVKEFKEKPKRETAEQYIRQGALWNGGVFAFQLGYLLNRAHALIDFHGYEDLFANYEQQRKISFDYAVVEHEPSIQVLRYHGSWQDIGSWGTLAQAIQTPVLGKGYLDGGCRNTTILNELSLPVLCMGCENLIVAAAADGILVADKNCSDRLKDNLAQVEEQVMFFEKSWGTFAIVDRQPQSMTARVTLRPGKRMSYHRHMGRNEVWMVIQGAGSALVDGKWQDLAVGSVVRLPSGTFHMARAGEEGLTLLESQFGETVGKRDKQKSDVDIGKGTKTDGRT